MKIHIEKIMPIPSGNLKAFVSIRIGPLTMHDWRIIQQPNQRAYVSPPQVEFQGADGRKRFKPLLECPQWKDEIQNAVLAAWENELSCP